MHFAVEGNGLAAEEEHRVLNVGVEGLVPDLLIALSFKALAHPVGFEVVGD